MKNQIKNKRNPIKPNNPKNRNSKGKNKDLRRGY